MPKFVPILWASSNTLAGIADCIKDFYCGSSVTLSEMSDKSFSVFTGKGLVQGAHVVFKKGRYRFQTKEIP